VRRRASVTIAESGSPRTAHGEGARAPEEETVQTARVRKGARRTAVREAEAGAQAASEAAAAKGAARTRECATLPWLAGRPEREAARAAAKVDPIDLWKQYKATHDQNVRNRLIERYLPLVRYTAERVFAKLPQNVELDDLTSAGIFGLIDAIDGFDLSRGVKFETYCTTRVRGAILDELRAFDWVPRLVRTKAHKLETALRKLEVDLGREPTDKEVAAMLGVSIDEFDALVKEASAVTVVSLSEKWPQQEDDSKTLRKVDFLEDKKQTKPIEFVHRKDIVEVATRGLSMKERLILLLYYFEDLTMREIGLALDLSESRVCQLHTRIMDRLREQLMRSRADLLS
jgi:RNA polymerase sigma factor for flagellar operon FliA